MFLLSSNIPNWFSFKKSQLIKDIFFLTSLRIFQHNDITNKVFLFGPRDLFDEFVLDLEHLQIILKIFLFR